MTAVIARHNACLLMIILVSFIGMGVVIAPGVAADEVSDPLGPTHEFEDGINAEITPAENSDGEKQTRDGAITYNVTLTGEVPRDTFPYIMPVEVTYSENDRTLGSDTVYMSPTQSEEFVPSYGGQEDDSEEYELREHFQVYIAFDDQYEDQLSEDGTQEREIEFDIQSRHTSDGQNVDMISEVEGETPSGRSVDTSALSTTEGVDEPTDVTHVDRYRVQSVESDPGHLEEFTIPESSGGLTGEVENFENMRNSGENSTVLRSGNDGLSVVTQTRDVSSAEPQTIAISYNIVSGDDIRVNPLDASGSEIDTDSEYILPEDPSDADDCIDVSEADDLCLFTLNEEEVEELNNLGELYLEYETDESVAAEVSCQSVITGYFPDDEITCGQTTSADGSLIAIEDFVGKDVDDTAENFTSDTVSPEFTADPESGETPYTGLDLQTNVTADLDDSVEVDVAIVEDSAIDSEGIDQDGILEQDRVEVEDDTIPVSAEDEVDLDDLIQVYQAVICETGTIESGECTSGDNIDTEQLNIIDGDGMGEPPEIEVANPIRIDLGLDEDASEEIVTERQRIQTTDSNFPPSERSDEEWQELEDEREEDWSGELRESVIVRDVDESNEALYESQAFDKRSDISPEGQWDDDYEARITTNETEVQYSADDPGEGWEATTATPERQAMTGVRTEEFEVLDGSEFASVTESESGWFVNRDDDPDDVEPTDGAIETLVQHIDPDDCLNCLPAETQEEADERFEDTPHVEQIETEGSDVWSRVSDEPVEQATLREQDYSFTWRTSEPDEGYTRAYESQDEDHDLWRDGSFEYENVYEWVRDDGIPQVEFQAPENEDVTRWERTTYDIEYQFTGEVEDESTLYTYQRDIEEVREEWEPEEVWFDLSGSDVRPGDSGKSLSMFEIEYQGTSEVVRENWRDDVHNVSHDDIDDVHDDVCDTTPDVREVPGGSGGVGIVEECDIDDETVITRVGKEYQEPGQFNPEITLWDDEGLVNTRIIDINVNEGPGMPEFEVEEINDQVDYQVGMLAFEGEIESETDDIGEEYDITVSPADTLETTQNCPSRNYNEDEELELQSQTNTTDTFREVVRCQLQGFDDYDEVPEEFELYTEVETEDGEERDYDTIPAGAIQSCQSPLESSGTAGECDVPSDTGDLDDSTTITYESGGSYQDVDAAELGGECPGRYDENATEDGNTTTVHCELTGDAEFDLKNRQKSINYDTVQSGVIERCEDIPTSSELGGHSGYVDTGDSDEEHCELADPTDPGPSGFTIAEEVERSDGSGTRTNYESPPSGAVRGEPLTEDKNIEECEEIERTDDDTFECEYSASDSPDRTIQYADITTGSWASVDHSIESFPVNTEVAEKRVWSSDFVMDGEEEFMEVMNPRETGLNLSDSPVDFTFELRNSDGDVVDSEEVEIELCEAREGESLPRETQGDYECDEFDTLLTGEVDFDSDRSTISDVVEEGREDPGMYQIESVKNDVCPYNHQLPRGHSDIEPLSVEIEEDTTTDEIREKAEQHLEARYGSADDPCSPRDYSLDTPETGEDEQPEPIPIPDPQEFEFDRSTFDWPDDRNNIRMAGIEDLVDHSNKQGNALQDNPAQSRWESGDIGNALRLGTPVSEPIVETDGPNDGLVAMYTFDHDPGKKVFTEDYQGVDAHDYRVNDVNVNTDSRYHARIWYGAACGSSHEHISQHHAWYEYDIQQGDGIDCEIYPDSLNREEAMQAFGDTMWETGQTTSGPGEELTVMDDIPDNQPAFLPAPPEEDVASSVIEGGYNDVELAELDERYADGLFGGNALSLDRNSWLMVTPPCLDESSFGEDSGNTTECEYRGGYDDIHTGDEATPSYTLSDRLESHDYTVSFWVKYEADNTNRHSTSGIGSQSTTHPLRQIIGVGIPESAMGGNLHMPYLHTSAELTAMDIPSEIDWKDEDGESIDEWWNPAPPDQTLYPHHADGETSLGAPPPGEDPIEGDINYEEGLAWVVDGINHMDVDQDNYFDPRMDHDTDNPSDHYAIQAPEWEPYGWQHVTITFEDDYYAEDLEEDATEEDLEDTDTQGGSGKFTVYVNGWPVDEGEAPPGMKPEGAIPTEGDDTDDRDSVDTGIIYEDSVISVGARYQDAGYTQDSGAYKPIIQASEGDILIDEMRIYEEALDPLSEELGGTMSDIVYNQQSIFDEYEGDITSSVTDTDANGDNIGDHLTPSSVLDVHVDYDMVGTGTMRNSGEAFSIEVIPCYQGDPPTTSDCVRSAAGELDNTDLEDADSTRVTFDEEELESEDIEEVDSVQFHVELESGDIEVSPVIHGIDIESTPAPYSVCQELESQYSSYSGSNIPVELHETSDVVTKHCDFDTDDGGWTKFYWAEEGEQYADTDVEGSAIMDDKDMSDCNPYEEHVCLSSADFDIPTHMEIEDFNTHDHDVDSESDLNGQILIKAIEDGNTAEWVAFELDPDMNSHAGEDSLDWVSDFESALEDGESVSGSSTGFTHEERSSNCLYPFASSANHEGECISEVRIDASGYTTDIEIFEGVYSGIQTAPIHEHTYVDMNINHDEREVDSVTCLDRDDVDRCEIYYRVGTSGDYENMENPHIDDGYFYTTGNDDNLQKVDEERNTVWEYDGTDGYGNTRGPALDNSGDAYITAGSAEDDMTLHKVDGETGTTEWSLTEGEGGAGAVGYHNGYVYYGGTDNTVRQVDADTGNLVWEHEVSTNIREIEVDNSGVYVGVTATPADYVAKLDHQGNEEWTYDINSPRSIALDSDYVYAARFSNDDGPTELHRIDKDTGSREYAFDVSEDGELSGLAEYGGYLYIGIDDTLQKVDSDAGSTDWEWTNPPSTSDNINDVAIDDSGEMAIVGDDDGFAYVYDTDLGASTWSEQTQSFRITDVEAEGDFDTEALFD